MFHLFDLYTQKLAGKKYFIWYFTFIIFLTILFFSFPPFYSKITSSTWDAIFYQIAHPFKQIESNDLSHESKLTFRLFPVFVGKVFLFNKFAFLVFQYILGLLSIRFVLEILIKKLENITFAFLLTLAYGFLYVGKVSFIEMRGIFDGVAIFLLILPFRIKHPLVVFFSIFFAAWTDERGLIASSFIFIYFLYSYLKEKSFHTNKVLYSIILSWFLYFLSRVFLSYFYGLETNAGGINFKTLALNLELAPLSLFGGLEGFWVLFFMAFVFKKTKIGLIDYLAIFSTSIVLFVSFMVYDVSRSLAYLFPVVFLALQIIIDTDKKMITNKLIWILFWLSFLYPAYCIAGIKTNWSKPFIIEYIFQFFTNS
jgi:hypothetical protein